MGLSKSFGESLRCAVSEGELRSTRWGYHGKACHKVVHDLAASSGRIRPSSQKVTNKIQGFHAALAQLGLPLGGNGWNFARRLTCTAFFIPLLGCRALKMSLPLAAC